MITCAYATIMAVYGAEMNCRLYAAAARLSDAERRLDRGAFWKSIHGTFNHLLWGDLTWMSRFAGWDRPAVPLGQSFELCADFDDLRKERVRADDAITEWAATLSPEWLRGNCTWVSGAAGRKIEAPREILLTHFFNHQTHHRGQVHAMLTAAGQQTGDTDLFLVLAQTAA